MNKKEKKKLEQIAVEHGILKPDSRPVFIVDHEKLRQNFRTFRESLPRVQPYFAVKANSDPEIVKSFYEMGSSFDVASYPEFMRVYRLIKDMPDKERQDFIWDKIIYANTIKPEGTLRKLNKYKPLVTFDNPEELKKIKRYAPNAGLMLRISVSNTGSQVDLSSKFGAAPSEAVNLVASALEQKLNVEGLSFHVGSQCNNFENYVQALEISKKIFEEADSRGYKIGAEKSGQKGNSWT